MKQLNYDMIEGTSFGYWTLLGIFGVFIAAGLGSAYYMETNGHYVTGMNNQIVWGMPHVFAVFLIVAASGALNVASIGSVFGKVMYKPLARLSALLAITLLVGGLAVLVLDLGRPDRLIISMTIYNFKSIFAWNMILYSGFIAVVGIYIWTMMQRNLKKYNRAAGMGAFIWRLTLTTGTGSIFGFLVARSAYDAAIMAPLFIIMSFSFGLAIFLVYLIATYHLTGRPLGDVIVNRLRKLLGVFVISVLYFVLVYHLTNLYIAEHSGIEQFILLDGGIYTKVFWIDQIIIGSLIPLLIFYVPVFYKSRLMLSFGALLVVFGGLAQLYVIIIGGQAYPLQILPGMEISSSFGDGQTGNYTATPAEILLGIGGVGIALAATTFAIKVLPFLPQSLANEAVDPHSTPPTT